MDVKFNRNLKYYEYNSEELNKFIDYVVYRTKIHEFSPLEQIIYVQDILKECINNSICESYNIRDNMAIICKNGSISSVSFPYIYSKVLQKLGINSKVYYLFNKDLRCYMGRVVYLLDDPKYKITGVYINSFEYKKDKIVYNKSPYFNCFKTPVQSDFVTKDLAFPIHDCMFEINFLKQLNKKGLAKVEDKYFSELNNISLFIDGNMLFPSHVYLPHKEFIKDVLIHEDIQDIVDIVEKYYSMMGNVIGADEILSAIYTVRRFEILEGLNVELSRDSLVDIVVNGNLMFERDVNKELENLDCALFNISNGTTVHDFIDENNWDEEIEKIKMYSKKK